MIGRPPRARRTASGDRGWDRHNRPATRAGIGQAEFEQLGRFPSLAGSKSQAEMMRLALEILRFNAADEATAPARRIFAARSVRCRRSKPAAASSVAIKGSTISTAGDASQRNRAPDAERGQVDIMPAVDVVDDGAIEPADIHADEEVVGFALLMRCGAGSSRTIKRVLAFAKFGRDIVSSIRRTCLCARPAFRRSARWRRNRRCRRRPAVRPGISAGRSKVFFSHQVLKLSSRAISSLRPT